MIKKLKKAFTITELVIVIAVIAILAAVLIPTFSNVIRNANQSAALQTCTNALKDYQAIAIEEGKDVDDMDGMGFVYDGYAYVYLNSSLQYVGETSDLMRIGTNYSIVNPITQPGDVLQRPTGSGSNSVTVTLVTGDENDTDAKIVFKSTVSDPDNEYSLGTGDVTSGDTTVTKANEVVYFYEVTVNNTAYAGYFTLEVATTDVSPVFHAEGANYSHRYGVIAEGTGNQLTIASA